MSLFSSWIASPPPDAAIEIATDRVAVGVVGERGGDEEFGASIGATHAR